MLLFAPQGDVAPPERSAVAEPFQGAIRTSVPLRSPGYRKYPHGVVVNLNSLRACELGDY